MDLINQASPPEPLGVNGSTNYTYSVGTASDLSGSAPDGTIVYVKDVKSFMRFDFTLNAWTPVVYASGITTVAMADADQVLTAAQYSRKFIVCTGALSADRSLTFPAITGIEWVVINNTTVGPYQIVCKRATGAVTRVPTGRECGVMWDGTDMGPTRGCNGAGSFSLNGTTEVVITYPGLLNGQVPRITRYGTSGAYGAIYLTALNVGVDFRVKSSLGGDNNLCLWDAVL